MATLSELMVKVGADISGFTSGMNKVDQQMKTFGTGMQNVGNNMQQFGRDMTTQVTAPLLAVGGAAIFIGAKFDKQMSKVMAISGATGKEFEKLRDIALDLGSSTSFSSSEVAFAMEQLASSGMDTTQIMGSISGVLDMAASSAIDLATAAEITGATLNGFGLKAEEAGRVSDILAKSAAISAADTVGLGEAFKYVAPVAASFGHTIEETAAAVGILSDAGIKGGQAGTTLRMGLLRLASPSKEARGMMEDLGLSFFDAQGKMKSMSGIVGELNTKMADLTDEQKAHYLATIFGAESVSGFIALMKAGTEELDKNTKALEESGGEAQRMAKIMMDNLAGAWEELTGALESLAIAFSDVMKDDLKAFATMLTNLANHFNKLSPSVKRTIVIIGLLVAAIPPLLIVMGLTISAFGTLSATFGSFLVPVLAIAVAIGGLVYMFKDELYAALLGIKDAIKPFITAFQILTGQYDEQIAMGTKMGETLETMFGSKVARIVYHFKVFSAKVKNAFATFKDLVKSAIPHIQDFAKIIGTHMNKIIDIAAPVFEEIKTLVSDGLKALKSFWDKDGSKIMEKAKTIFQGISDVIVAVFAYVMPFVSDAIAFIREKFSVISAWWNENGAMIQQAVSNVFNFIWGVIQFIMPVVQWLVETTWNAIKGAIDGALNVIMGVINFFAALFTGNWDKLWSSLWQIIVGAIELIWNVLNIMFIGRILKGVGGLFQLMKSSVSKGWTAIKNFFVNAVNSIKTSVSNWVTNIKNNFEMLRTFGANIFQAFKSVMLNIWDNIVMGVKSKITNLKNGAINAFNNLKGMVTSIFNGIKNAILKPVQSAKEKILGIIDAIKNAFNMMKIKIPKPKLPKVSVTMVKNSWGIPYPDFDISWNAKGGIWNSPTLLGGGQGVGEAGAEAVLPIQHKRYMKPFTNAIVDNMREMGIDGGGKGSVTNQFTVHATVREDADIEKIAKKLHELQTRANRSGGRN